MPSMVYGRWGRDELGEKQFQNSNLSVNGWFGLLHIGSMFISDLFFGEHGPTEPQQRNDSAKKKKKILRRFVTTSTPTNIPLEGDKSHLGISLIARAKNGHKFIGRPHSRVGQVLFAIKVKLLHSSIVLLIVSIQITFFFCTFFCSRWMFHRWTISYSFVLILNFIIATIGAPHNKNTTSNGTINNYACNKLLPVAVSLTPAPAHFCLYAGTQPAFPRKRADDWRGLCANNYARLISFDTVSLGTFIRPISFVFCCCSFPTVTEQQWTKFFSSVFGLKSVTMSCIVARWWYWWWGARCSILCWVRSLRISIKFFATD